MRDSGYEFVWKARKSIERDIQDDDMVISAKSKMTDWTLKKKVAYKIKNYKPCWS